MAGNATAPPASRRNCRRGRLTILLQGINPAKKLEPAGLFRRENWQARSWRPNPPIGFRLRQREFDPFLGLGIEACDLVDLMLADPDVAALLVDDNRIVAAI